MLIFHCTRACIMSYLHFTEVIEVFRTWKDKNLFKWVFSFFCLSLYGVNAQFLCLSWGVCDCVCVWVCVCVSHCLRERIIYRGMSGDPGFSIWEFPAPLNHEDSRLAFLATVQTRLTFLITCSWDEDSHSSWHAVETRTHIPHHMQLRQETRTHHHCMNEGLIFLITVQTRDSHSSCCWNKRLTFLTTVQMRDSHSSPKFRQETHIPHVVESRDSHSSPQLRLETHIPHGVETKDSHSSPQFKRETHIPHHSWDKRLTFLTTVETRDSHSSPKFRRETHIPHHSSDERLAFLTTVQTRDSNSSCFWDERPTFLTTVQTRD